MNQIKQIGYIYVIAIIFQSASYVIQIYIQDNSLDSLIIAILQKTKHTQTHQKYDFFDFPIFGTNQQQIYFSLLQQNQSNKMSKNIVGQKAWLKLSYKQEVYVPVIVLERASQLRSLVVDEGTSLDRKLAYFVDDNALLPRNQQIRANLLDMKYVNFPELKYFLGQRVSDKDEDKHKYIKIGANTIIDLQPPVENTLPNNQNSQLTKFYHTQLRAFLSNKKQTQKSIIVASKKNSNPHCYIDPLLHLMSKNSELWPHKIKIDKLGIILKKLLFNVCLEIKLGFLQNSTNVRQARKVMFVHLKPFLPVQPSEGLVIPQQVLNLGNSSKFAQMYKGPLPIQPQTPGSQIQAIIDALLSLGFQVKQVHSLMKLLSLIMNLQRIYVQKQVQGSADSKYATFHLKSRYGSAKQSYLQNIKEIIQLQQDKLQNLMFFGQYDHVSEMSLRQRQKLIYLQQLGNKQQLATFRVHTLKYLLYEMFIAQLCETLNKKLYSQNPACQSNGENKNRCLIVLSYGVADKTQTNIQQKQRIDSMFWINGRCQLQKRMLNIVKCNILASIIGSGNGNQKVQSKLRDDLQQSANKNYNLSNSPPKKQTGFITKNQTEYKSLKSFASYPESIQQLKNSIQSGDHKYEYKQAMLVHKELCLYKLYEEMSNYQILSEISMGLFKNLHRKDIIQQIPYTFYQYLWPNYQESQVDKGINFQSASSFVTNRELIFQQPSFLNKMTDAIRKKQIFMESQMFQNQMKGSVQMSLLQFACRYQYTQVGKQKMHRKYPKEIERLSKMTNKKNKINAATPFLDQESTIQAFMGKVEEFIKKEKPKQFGIVTINGFKKQQSIIEILDKQLMQKMELQVQNQLKAVKKIQRQFIVFRNRRFTNNIIYKIARERQLQRLMIRLYTRARCKIGIKNIIEFSELKYKKEQQELRRLKKLQQELEKQERRKKEQEERQRIRKLKEQQMARKQQQQERQQKLKQEQQQKQRLFKIRKEEQMKKKKQEQQKQIQRQKKLKEEEEEKKRKEQQIKNNNLNQNSNKPQQQIKNQNQPNQIKPNQVKPNETKPSQVKPNQIKPKDNQINQPTQLKNNPKQPSNPPPKQQNNHPTEQANQPIIEPTKNMQISQTNPTQNSQLQSRVDPQTNPSNNIQGSQSSPMFILEEPTPATNPKQTQSKQAFHLQPNNQQQQKQTNQPQLNKKQEQSQQNPTNDKLRSNSIPNEGSNQNPKQDEKKYKIKVQSNVIGQKKQENLPKKEQMKEEPQMHLLNTSNQPKKNENQYIEKSQNIQQLSNEELLTIQDHPIISLQQWQKNFKLKSEKTQSSAKQVFTKYGSMTQRLTGGGKSFQLPKPQPDEQILDTFMDDNYLQYVKENLNYQDGDEFANMLVNQKQQLVSHYFKDYPLKKYPTYFKQAFNAILKIGYQKNSSKGVNELLNVFVVPLYQSYYAELAQMKSMFEESAMIPSDHSSPHNILKDEVFLYFMKQITSIQFQKLPRKCRYGYLYGLSVFTRSFSPSPEFLYPFTQQIHSLYKKAIEGNMGEELVGLLESVFENLLLFIQANQGFKRNFVKAFVTQKDKPQVLKNQTECAGYLHLRKTPISQFQTKKSEGKLKPQPPLLTIWLVNNESFTYPVRNQIVKTIKKKVLSQIGFLFRQQCFSLYFLQPDGSYTVINQKQKAVNLFPLMQAYKQLGKRRPIYCRISHYFPFNLRDINSTRMMYLNMISDEITYPFTAQQYEFLAAQSLAYEDYEQVRIGNYLTFSDQLTSKNHDTKPVQQKYKQVALEASKKICQFQYLKYMKSIGFLLMKCHSNLKEPTYMIGIKPIQITFYKNKQIIASIHMRRVRNVYLTDKKVVLELYYKGNNEDQERLRMLTLQFFKKSEQLFKCILFHLENRISV